MPVPYKALKPGDTVAITCPAKFLPQPITHAVTLLQQWGLNVITGATCGTQYHQFAGTDDERAAEMQQFMNDDNIHAIICGRGGYGVIRIIDKLDFSRFSQNPKLICGFSDVTLLLNHLYAQYNICSLHSPMPYTFNEATAESLQTLQKALLGKLTGITYNNAAILNPGSAQGDIIGGNLSLMVAGIGSASQPDYAGKILILEDVAESPYSIDRMIRTLDRAGLLSGLHALLIGAFNELPEEIVPFGQSPEEIIYAVAGKYDYPIAAGLPVGHINNNSTFIAGAHTAVSCMANKVTLTYNI